MLRKPVKKGFFGLSWTVLTFPGMIIQGIYRRLGPGPRKRLQDMTREEIKEDQKKVDKLSFAYFAIAWTAFCATMYHVLGDDTGDGEKLKDFPGLESSEFYARKLVKSDTKKVTLFKMSGLNYEQQDITQDVMKNISGSGYSDDPNYDKYEDDEYIRKRLNNPEPGTYNKEVARYYIKRIDRVPIKSKQKPAENAASE